MKIYPYTSLDSNQHDSFYKFLVECSKETIQPASKNMYDIDWVNKNNTLLYLLNKTERFTENGSFNILFENDEVIACSGCYTSDFSSEVVISGSRTWIKNNYRHKHLAREYLLPYEKQWALNTNHKCILLTFNDYNKNLIKIWKRKRLGETREKRQPKHFGYNGIHTLDFPVVINYTKQYVLYEKLVPNFEFDWNTIKYT